MRVLVTGAAGFIGRHVTAALLERGCLRDAAGEVRPISEIILADVHAVDGVADGRVRVASGDFGDPAFASRLVDGGVDSVFHLAATLTMEAETEFDRGMAVNVHGVIRLLDACRTRARCPHFVFPSSIAAFGGKLPEIVDDAVAQTPQTSYGTHKSITELLINDYTRHGFIDGRALRLPIVLVRPGGPGRTVSDRVGAIVREPLLGRDVTCPLAANTRLPVASARRVAEALLDAHDLPPQAFGPTRAMNLPSLTVSVREMVGSISRFGGTRRLGNIAWQPDPAMQAVVDGWPAYFVSERAAGAGIRADASFDEIVDIFVEDFLSGSVADE